LLVVAATSRCQGRQQLLAAAPAQLSQRERIA
jgi:hypothetical protein